MHDCMTGKKKEREKNTEKKKGARAKRAPPQQTNLFDRWIDGQLPGWASRARSAREARAERARMGCCKTS